MSTFPKRRNVTFSNGPSSVYNIQSDFLFWQQVDENDDAVIVISDDAGDAALDLRVVGDAAAVAAVASVAPPEDRYNCAICELSRANESVFKRPVQPIEIVVCDVCNHKFRTKISLRGHKEKYHGGLITLAM